MNYTPNRYTQRDDDPMRDDERDKFTEKINNKLKGCNYVTPNQVDLSQNTIDWINRYNTKPAGYEDPGAKAWLAAIQKQKRMRNNQFRPRVSQYTHDNDSSNMQLGGRFKDNYPRKHAASDLGVGPILF